MLKLLNTKVMEQQPLVMEFMESFEMHEQQVENLVDHSWQIERQFNCTGIGPFNPHNPHLILT